MRIRVTWHSNIALKRKSQWTFVDGESRQKKLFKCVYKNHFNDAGWFIKAYDCTQVFSLFVFPSHLILLFPICRMKGWLLRILFLLSLLHLLEWLKIHFYGLKKFLKENFEKSKNKHANRVRKFKFYKIKIHLRWFLKSLIVFENNFYKKIKFIIKNLKI